MTNKMNDMVRIEHDGKLSWITVPHGCGQVFANCTKVIDDRATVTVYTPGQMQLEALPAEVQEDVRETLMAYNSCSVNYESGRFNVSPSTCIKRNYSNDAFACGNYRAEDVFTTEERKRNYIDTFGHAPAYA